MASPLHAAYPDSKHTRNLQNTTLRDASPSPLNPGPANNNGPSSPSKQTRRLHLRNAGFRAANVPSREVAPKSQQSSTSTNWSSISSFQQSSDAENVSPLSGKRAGTENTNTGATPGLTATRESSSGILQDIGNANSATFRQANSKRPRTRVTSGKFWSSPHHETSLSTFVTDDPASSPPPSQQASGARPRSLRIPRTKMGRPRRSVSGETRKYVDHLEQQLSEAQSQLSAMTSPTVTREQSTKMRHLNAETRQLQEDIAAWEAKYEDRVQEEMDKHYQIESTLRSRIRSLEEETEMTKYRVQDLEAELETTKQNTEAVETANVNLEKRLEILSELLAASPTKIDLHAPIPGRRRQSRPHSMLPRFPTAGFLVGSPERSSPWMHAASPSSSVCRFSSAVPLSPSNLVFSPEVASDDEESSNSDMNSVIVAPPTTKKPMRRMRRFGAGSIGPKPLILPSTSHCEQIPASAPPFDRDEPHGAFPFSSRFDALPEQTHTRCRSSSDARPGMALSPSPLESLESSNPDEGLVNDTIGFGSPPSRISVSNITRDFSSIGSGVGAVVGRNLMEELTAVRSSDSLSETEQINETQIHIPTDDMADSSPFNSDAEDDRPIPPPENPNDKEVSPPEALTARFASGSSTAVAPSTVYGTLRLPEPPELLSRSSTASVGVRSNASISTLDSLRIIFSNLFRSPVELAKHLVQTAQSRMSIPRPLLTVQWWLVGVLLGPMARRRMLGKSKPCCKDSLSDRQSLMSEENPDTSDPIAYGVAYQTPKSSPSQNQVRSLVAGMGKKRTPSPFSDARSFASPCPHHPKHFKHHPWLWLKFSMTLALAVGVAFKDGPSSLLKDAACQCKKSGRRLSTGPASANWRNGRRDRVLVTPEIDDVDAIMVGPARGGRIT